MADVFAKEVPGSLKQLARLICRGFYTIEFVLVVDMLIRYPCVKEEDLESLLKFDKKQIRAILAQLKQDKFVKIKLKMETGADSKATRQTYYYINYKLFVNVVKYKLDHVRRKIETEERDSTSRASFKCAQCLKTYTDLEVNLLMDPMTGILRCTYCRTVVEEDEEALPKQDSRLLLAKFNEQIQVLYTLLREVEDVKLAPDLLDPEPTDLSEVTGAAKPVKVQAASERGGTWSGEATRHRDLFNAPADMQIVVGGAQQEAEKVVKKEQPVWMTESTVIDKKLDETDLGDTTALPLIGTVKIENAYDSYNALDLNPGNQDNIIEVLLAHEKGASDKKSKAFKAGSDNDTNTSESEDEKPEKNAGKNKPYYSAQPAVAQPTVDSEVEEEEVLVKIGASKVPVSEITADLIKQMTSSEKESYIKLTQELYASMYE